MGELFIIHMTSDVIPVDGAGGFLGCEVIEEKVTLLISYVTLPFTFSRK